MAATKRYEPGDSFVDWKVLETNNQRIKKYRKIRVLCRCERIFWVTEDHANRKERLGANGCSKCKGRPGDVTIAKADRKRRKAEQEEMRKKYPAPTPGCVMTFVHKHWKPVDHTIDAGSFYGFMS